MNRMKWTLTSLLLLAVLIAGCSSDPISGSGSVDVGNNSSFLLPPFNPGNLVGDTLMIPEEDIPPSVRAAYCFPGVADPGTIGIGSMVGTSTIASLPVNVNSGDTAIGSYSVTVTVSDPSVAIDVGAISGSLSFLATGTCAARGCPDGCEDFPLYYPNLYWRAPGFEAAPTVSGDSVSVTISATDTGIFPASRIFNLANVPIHVVGTLPYGGVDILFAAVLNDRSGNPVAADTANGLVIQKFHIIFN